MNNDMNFSDEMRYALFLTELMSVGVAMCSELLDQSQLKVLQARANKFLIDTAIKRAISQ
jgi:hypothetical protein